MVLICELYLFRNLFICFLTSPFSFPTGSLDIYKECVPTSLLLFIDMLFLSAPAEKRPVLS